MPIQDDSRSRRDRFLLSAAITGSAALLATLAATLRPEKQPTHTEPITPHAAANDAPPDTFQTEILAQIDTLEGGGRNATSSLTFDETWNKFLDKYRKLKESGDCDGLNKILASARRYDSELSETFRDIVESSTNSALGLLASLNLLDQSDALLRDFRFALLNRFPSDDAVWDKPGGLFDLTEKAILADDVALVKKIADYLPPTMWSSARDNNYLLSRMHALCVASPNPEIRKIGILMIEPMNSRNPETASAELLGYAKIERDPALQSFIGIQLLRDSKQAIYPTTPLVSPESMRELSQTAALAPALRQELLAHMARNGQLDFELFSQLSDSPEMHAPLLYALKDDYGWRKGLRKTKDSAYDELAPQSELIERINAIAPEDENALRQNAVTVAFKYLPLEKQTEAIAKMEAGRARTNMLGMMDSPTCAKILRGDYDAELRGDALILLAERGAIAGVDMAKDVAALSQASSSKEAISLIALVLQLKSPENDKNGYAECNSAAAVHFSPEEIQEMIDLLRKKPSYAFLTPCDQEQLEDLKARCGRFFKSLDILAQEPLSGF